MGLDIRLYRGLKEISEEQYDKIEGDSAIYTYQIEKEWNTRNTLFKNEAYYKYKECLFEQRYAYSTHSHFRKYLQQLQGLETDWIKVKDFTTPFYYLFDFGDNEGCFDYLIGKVLLDNFKLFKKENDKSHDVYMQGIYNDWLEMLELMKETDLVYFS